MKIAVIAAGGRVGSLFTDEAVKRGHDVTAFVRTQRDTSAQRIVVKDALDIKQEDLEEFDVVVDAFGAIEPDRLHLHDDVTKVLADTLSGTDTKLYIVGGAGSLNVDGELLWKTDLLREEFKPLAAAMAEAFDNLKTRGDVDWVYVSPALDFRPDVDRKEGYIVAGDDYETNDEGKSSMAYADYAVALADIVEGSKYSKQRISLLSR